MGDTIPPIPQQKIPNAITLKQPLMNTKQYKLGAFPPKTRKIMKSQPKVNERLLILAKMVRG